MGKSFCVIDCINSFNKKLFTYSQKQKKQKQMEVDGLCLSLNTALTNAKKSPIRYYLLFHF